jgi:hypothetical protein
MQRLKVLVVALLGVFVLGAFASATASALPEILNKAKEVAGAVKFSGETKKETTFSILKGIGVVKCTTTISEAETKAKTPLGPFHIHWTGCKVNASGITGPCTGLGDTAEQILALGELHIVFDSLKPLGAAVLFLLETVHFTCTVLGIETLILVKGQVLCLISPINALSKTAKINCEAKSEGDPAEVVYWNDEGKEVNIAEGLLGSEDGGKTFKMAAQSGLAEVTFSEEIELMA